MSFRSVEHPSFIEFVKYLNNKATLPKRQKLRDLLEVKYSSVQNSIREQLQHVNRISIAIDAWTSPNHLAFLGITAYYITPDWNIKEILLGFRRIKGRHSGKNFARLIQNTLCRYGLQRKLLAVTADNVTTNDTARKEIASALKQFNVNWDSEQGTINCMAHVIQLVVKTLCNKPTPKSQKKRSTLESPYEEPSEEYRRKYDPNNPSPWDVIDKVFITAIYHSLYLI
jgi:hypothetical protein